MKAPKKLVPRRNFLKNIGLGVLAAGFGAVPGITSATSTPEQNPMEKKKLGWAIVGLGEFATKQLIPAFAACQHSRLVALVSGDAAKAKRLATQYELDSKNIYNYQNYDTLKDNPDVDVIYIVLPNSMHAEFTIRGAQAGKHTMCEKPMATNVEDAKKMISACQKAGKKLMIAYRAQYEPFNLKAMELARSGKLGQLRLITSDHGRQLDPSKPSDKWRADKKLAGGGCLMDVGIYSLQAARYISGEEPVEVSAFMHSSPNDPRFKEVEESMVFSLRFPSGVLANCSTSYNYADTKRLQVFGTEKNLTLDPATDYYEHNLMIKDKEGKQEMKIKEENQFALEIDHFSECLLQNKNPKTPGEEGLQDMKLMMALYESAQKGRPVKVS